MVLRITQAQMESIRGHGAQDYPSECCGALLGKVEGESKQVMEVVALKNLRHDPGQAQQLLPVDDLARETERNRFLIDPLEQLRMEKDARSRGLDVLGYYHSHPDHPARPSVYDREHAWPWYSYIIVSVDRGVAKDLTCWVLAEDGGVFNPESVEVVENRRVL
jgi:proteasome lid subunit RPN8/RPN11